MESAPGLPQLHGSVQLGEVARIVERVRRRVVSCQSRSANHHTGADQGSPPFRQGARCFAAKGAIEAAGGDAQVMAVAGRDVASRKVSLVRGVAAQAEELEGRRDAAASRSPLFPSP
jgi:hypothetical protein